jgi:serine/threonine protein kinase
VSDVEQSPRKTALGTVGQLGRYRLIEPLGVGGMAETFRATYSGPAGFERTVVVKRILPANCGDPEFLQMFAAEARILGMLHHPNVVQVYDFGESDGTLFLVLEYVDGPSIGRLLRVMRKARRPIPVAIAAHIAREICRALDYVHSLRTSDGEPLNVIHRDVTPSNIMLTTTGAVKLLDFGIAKYETSGTYTQHRMIKGKTSYMAPEMVEERPFDARADLFSLGVVLHEILTLAPLFTGDNDLATLRRVMDMRVEPPSRRRPDVPAQLDAITMTALQRDPAQRYGSAGAMVRALDEIVIASKLHSDGVVDFLREIEPLLNEPTPSLAEILASAPGSLRTEPEAEVTKRDLRLRLRMSPIGRFFFGRDAK